MMTRFLRYSFVLILLLPVVASAVGAGAISIIDVQPDSTEAEQNSEPSLAVNPLDTQQLLITAFSNTTSPVFYSGDGGGTWANVQMIGSSDSSMDWSSGGNAYFGNISLDGNTLEAWTWDPGQETFNQLPNSLLTPGGDGPDQPNIAVDQVGGADHVYIGFNDLSQPVRTASVHYSLDSGTTWNTQVVENVDPGVMQDGYSIRPAVSGSTVYLCFERWNEFLTNQNFIGDVVVVSDTNGGSDHFQDLGADGAIADASVQFPEENIGHERTGSDVTIALSPTNSSMVYIAYCVQTNGVGTVKVQMSINGGTSWSPIYQTIVHSALPSVAVASNGAVGLLYTAIVNGNLETHFIQSDDNFATHQDLVISRFPDNSPKVVYQPYIGDFETLRAVGDVFYGTFCASNNTALYPFPVTFVRDRAQLGTSVPYSIDPFYFTKGALSGSFVDQPAVAINQLFQFSGTSSLTVNVLTADTNPSGDSLALTGVTQGKHGAVAFNVGGKVVYAPSATFTGSDSFTYTISDGNGGTSMGTITVETPFYPFRGTYNGLVANSPQTNAGTGVFQAAVNYLGRVTGKIVLGGVPYLFTKALDSSGDASPKAVAASGSSVALSLNLPMPSGGAISGTATSGTTTIAFVAPVDPYNTTSAAPEAGKRFTFAIPHNTSDLGALFPQGDGHGSVTVSAGGLVSVAGVLGDGTAFTESAYLSGSGTWPFYVGLYLHRGYIAGNVAFSGTVGLSGTLQWVKQAISTAPTYPAGFTMPVGITGTNHKATAGQPIIFADNAGAGTVTLNGPNTTLLTHHITVGNLNKVTVTDPGADKLQLTLTPGTGGISGSFYDTVAKKTVLLHGIVLQPDNGYGEFVESGLTGWMELQ